MDKQVFNFIFLICSERSGSNFITSLLNAHSCITGPPPTHLFRLFGTNVENYGDLSKDENWHVLVEDVVRNFECKLGIWHTSITKEELLERAEKRSAGELLRIIYEQEAAFDKAQNIFIKENHTYRFSQFLLNHFPECKFILMVRDPRDVASSWVCTESIPGGVEKAINTWIDDQSQSTSLLQKLRNFNRMIVVRYEDLITDTDQTLQRITAFLGLSYEEGMKSFHKHPRTKKNADTIEAWANLSKPVLNHNSGKYRTTLSLRDVRYVELRCFELMKLFGYLPETVRELPAAEELEQELFELGKVIQPGNYLVRDFDEQEIRKRRLAAIDTVLERRL